MRPFRTKAERLAEIDAANKKAMLDAEQTPAGRPPVTHVYGRASKRKQVESPETQKTMAKAYCDYNKLTNIVFYIDPDTSGKTLWHERQAGGELMRNLRRGDNVVITKLDRAFRRLKDCVDVLDKFERMGVKLHICNLMGGAIDLSSPMGRFMIHILAAFAELERSFISERTKDGIRNRVNKGFKHSRHPGYGFRWERKWIGGKWVKLKVDDPEERRAMKSILCWRLQDDPLSWAEIQTHLANLSVVTKDGKPWTEQRIRRACKAEMLLRIKAESIGLKSE